VNKDLAGNPELVNKDPYGKGWMVKIRIANTAELATLLDAAAYGAILGK
jgi:glycine cleavage system H protein